MAARDIVVMDEDGRVEVEVLANDRDPDGDPIRIVDVTSSSLVTATIVSSRVQLQGSPNLSGNTVLSYLISDGDQQAEGEIAIEIAAVNDAPVAKSAAVTTARDTAVALPLAATDVENSPVTFEIVRGPDSGHVREADGEFVYTPGPGFSGSDSVEFVAEDGELRSETAEIEITVAPGVAPVANSDSITTDEDAPVGIELSASDEDGDPLSFRVTSPPTRGSLSGSGPSLVYTPGPNFSGTDAFQFVAADDWLDSEPATIAIDVRPVQDPPVATASMVSTDEDTTLAITLLGTDPDDEDILSFTISGPPQHGFIRGTPPNIEYVPDDDFNGSDSIGFTVSDGNASAQAEVGVEVRPVNDVPVPTLRRVNTDEDTAIAFELTGYDVEGSDLEFEITSQPENGTISGSPPNVEYTPDADTFGVDTFLFRVSDGELVSEPLRVLIQVAPVNDAPRVSGPTTFTTQEDQSLSFAVSLDDPEGDDLTPTIVAPPSEGTLVARTTRTFRYEPAPDYFGSERVTIEFRDDEGAATAVDITLVVEAVADAIVTRPDLAQTEVDTPVVIDVLQNDFDPDGQNLVLAVGQVQAGGEAAVVDGKIEFTPTPGFSGSTNFLYSVSTEDRRRRFESVAVGVGEFPQEAPLDAVTLDEPGGYESVALSADGRYVAFASRPGTSDDRAPTPQVFVLDRLTSTTELVSATADGGPANGASGQPAMSADGRYVAFASQANNLVPDDTNRATDVFVRDRVLGTVTRVSVGNDGEEANGFSSQPSISADGRRIAFGSTAFNLVAGDFNGTRDVFIRDLEQVSTTRVSVRSDGGEADRSSSGAAITADATGVAFDSYATNIVPDDTNGERDVFFHDLHSGVVSRVSVSSTGRQNAGRCESPSASEDGRFIAFYCAFGDIVGPNTPSFGIFVHDRTQKNTTVALAQFDEPTISSDGRFVIGEAFGEIAIRDRFAGKSEVLADTSTRNGAVTLSTDGVYAAFVVGASLVDIDTNEDTDVYVAPNPLR